MPLSPAEVALLPPGTFGFTTVARLEARLRLLPSGLWLSCAHGSHRRYVRLVLLICLPVHVDPLNHPFQFKRDPSRQCYNLGRLGVVRVGRSPSQVSFKLVFRLCDGDGQQLEVGCGERLPFPFPRNEFVVELPQSIRFCSECFGGASARQFLFNSFSIFDSNTSFRWYESMSTLARRYLRPRSRQRLRFPGPRKSLRSLRTSRSAGRQGGGGGREGVTGVGASAAVSPPPPPPPPPPPAAVRASSKVKFKGSRSQRLSRWASACV